MKKAFDQTVRDLKREVNKKVLKVPGIEQKILDATSNEPWGPHGSHLADIAQATRNYHEYQMIMNVIWKRINDTGKNWRHVYKALTVLEYLVGHGSERVIDEIREHAYQISTLSDFQYLDHNGRDQGSNVRRKSQTLVAVVNDKEKIQEARAKALANKDKYRSTYATGGRLSSFSGSGGYGDRYDDDRFEGRYGSRDEDRNGSGRERDWGYRDEDRYGRGGDSYNRDGDRYGRDSDDRYGRDNYKDDDYRGGRGSDDYKFGPRNRSFDRDRERSFDDDDRYSSRSGGGRADDPSQDDRRLELKLSEQSIGGPPGYEEAVKDAHNHMQDERNGANVTAPVTKASSPPAPKVASPVAPFPNNEVDSFDEFDPRGSMPAAAPAASSSGGDFFGAPSTSDPIYGLALVPVTSTTTTSEVDAPTNPGFGTDFVALSSAPSVLSQSSADPFGDAPFKAAQQENFRVQQPSFAPATSFQAAVGSHGGAEPLPQAAPKAETVPSFDFGDPLGGLTYTPSLANGHEHSSVHPAFFAPEAPMVQAGNGFVGSITTSGSATLVPPPASHQSGAPTNVNIFSQNAAVTPQVPQPLVNAHTQSGPSSQPASLASTSVPPLQTQKSKDKFETKSTVWTDTLNRGLVNLNISGPKINPLADIGIDFDSINRMEKRKEKEKSSATAVASTVTMGKAMGSGSGIGRAGALAPPANPMMGGGMRMGMGAGNGIGMGMGGAGGMGMGMGMGGYGAGMNQPMGMGMGMNMAPMRPPPGMPGVGYNPVIGMGNYSSQQPYGGGYR